MFSQIVIDCQTQTDRVVCEYCIANKECILRTNLDKPKKENNENESLTIISSFPCLQQT
jgi:hypothetical protein